MSDQPVVIYDTCEECGRPCGASHPTDNSVDVGPAVYCCECADNALLEALDDTDDLCSYHRNGGSGTCNYCEQADDEV